MGLRGGDIENWLRRNTFRCEGMGARLSPEMCRNLRERPTLREVLEKDMGIEKARPAACERCMKGPGGMSDEPLQVRAGWYASAFPGYPALTVTKRWVCGLWVMGRNYERRPGREGEKLHGAYPPNYVKRVMAFFPDAAYVLHLFSGSVNHEDVLFYTPSVRRMTFIDLNIEDSCFDVQGRRIHYCRTDAHEISKRGEDYDLILADPPYTKLDAARYGHPPIKRGKVFEQCASVLQKGGWLVWLDVVLPMFSKREWSLDGLIGLVRSTNHRVRLVSIFRRL